jgi:iron complex transport system substrate-binding protein
MSRNLTQLAPSLLLIVLTGTVGAAVGRFTSSVDGQRLLQWSQGQSNSAIHTGPSEYPRTAIDSSGYRVRIPRPPRRIVSQYWAIDEFAYSVVPPERVVAVSASAYLKTVSNVYSYVERFHPAIAVDPERVLRLDPDLILVSDTSRPDFCAIVRDAHIPIYRMFTSFTTLQQIADGIRATGYLTGEDEQARAEVNRFWSAINKAKSLRPADASPPRILGYSGGFTYGANTLFDDIVRTLGGVNVGAEGGLKGYDEATSEQIIRWNPDWIITSADSGKEKQVLASLMADPGIALTNAARNKRIVVVPTNVFLPMSPFTANFVTLLAEKLYG